MDPQRVVHILVLPQDEHGGKDTADQGGQCCADDPHAEAVDQQCVAGNVDDIHDKAGQHADAAVALCAEKSRAAVIQADERVGHGADKEILLGKPHDILINAAENAAQDRAGKQHAEDGHCHSREAKHAVQLGGAAAGVFLIPAAQILAGNDRTAGSQRGQDLNNQNIQAVHQRYAGDSGLTHAGNHQGVGHTHRDAEGLLQQKGPDQCKQRPFGKHGCLRFCGDCHGIAPFYMRFA